MSAAQVQGSNPDYRDDELLIDEHDHEPKGPEQSGTSLIIKVILALAVGLGL